MYHVPSRYGPPPTAAAATVLLAVEQPSEHVDFGVRQPAGERVAGGLRPGRRGTVHERAQSRPVRLQPLFRRKPRRAFVHFLV